jgi:hypothetical protein
MAIGFSDIQNNFYQKSILQLQQQAIINGYPEGYFRPDCSITRAEERGDFVKSFSECSR